MIDNWTKEEMAFRDNAAIALAASAASTEEEEWHLHKKVLATRAFDLAEAMTLERRRRLLDEADSRSLRRQEAQEAFDEADADAT